MQACKIDIDYSKQKEFWFFYTSDHHTGHKEQDKELLKEEFDEAKKRKAMIFINGDWGDFIMSGDRKRYTPSSDAYGTDNNVNLTINEAYDFYSNYIEFIELIGSGNHEATVSKFHNFDPTQQLIYSLNKEHKTKIKHGQYSGFIVLNFHDKKSRVRQLVIYYNHGQGGKAEITKGTIDLNRHLTTKQADIIWIGHKHTKVALPSEPVLCVDKKQNIYTKNRWAIITGSYLSQFKQYDAMKKGYRVSFGEEKMRTLQGAGGIFMKVTVHGTNSDLKIKFEV
jgi:hypothetical protein